MKWVLVLSIILLFLPIGFSRIDYLGIDTIIKDSSVEINFVVTNTNYFEFKIYGLVLNYTSNSDCKLEGNFFKCNLTDKEDKINLKVYLNNIIAKGPNKNILTKQFELKDDVEVVSVLVTLPVGMVLVEEKDAVFPSNFKTLTNGRNIIVYWELNNVSKFQPLSFKVTYAPSIPEESALVRFLKSFYMVLFISIVFLILLIYELFRTRRVIVKKIIKVPTEKIVLEVLDPDEKKIYEIVQKEGKIKQNRLVELTGFSKVKVSRVVKSLKDKKLINVEKLGKTNLISLRKKG
ncbi:MAG: hypothetical protein RMJ18_00610 [Candidatus Aenigmarchaeota archaeon]|nr:hypothetical protein [Candidatus Aenigmarchaeota archaeon]MDW8159911.1 hypothetical protein [Candidatus Aenigmarchaeota archaeon]